MGRLFDALVTSPVFALAFPLLFQWGRGRLRERQREVCFWVLVN